MLDADLKTQLKGYLERITHPIALVASVDDGEASGEMTALLRDVAEQSERVTLVRSDGVDTGERTPSFRIERTDTDIGVRFAALPTGHEFTSLVLALPAMAPAATEPLMPMENGTSPRVEPHARLRAFTRARRFKSILH